MAEIHNLRQARKRRNRAEKNAGAAVNRAAFGRSRADRAAVAAETERSTRDLDAHRREPGGNANGPEDG